MAITIGSNYINLSGIATQFDRTLGGPALYQDLLDYANRNSMPSSISGQDGKVLTSNGTTLEWKDPPSFSGGQLFTSSGTVNIPSGVTMIEFHAIGGGGPGIGAHPNNPGPGGYGGGYAYHVIPYHELTSNTITVAIGTGGSGGPASTDLATRTGTIGGATTISFIGYGSSVFKIEAPPGANNYHNVELQLDDPSVAVHRRQGNITKFIQGQTQISDSQTLGGGGIGLGARKYIGRMGGTGGSSLSGTDDPGNPGGEIHYAGNRYFAAAPGAGNNGNTGTSIANVFYPGAGGSGGGAVAGGAAGDGGTGGPGSGGGGGAVSSSASGAGGNGGNGIAAVYWW